MKPKMKPDPLELPPKRNPPGQVPHVIDWDKIGPNMEDTIDRHREVYASLVDGGWLKNFLGDDYCGLD